ncbi:hypothetical protein PVAND_015747 [Polypedilum vanderplanki]|uniref:Uncharacterized protein n=1 Tax=Polypedilum vanderplanki TaxID=319348 RepID=A0A9J6BD15_POLVA|nr:hypothetical protein PVAND_015747 [Polypedilum vanderplanki]
MKIFVVLLVAIISCSSASPFYEEYFDSNGECWRCYTGYPCERCIRTNNDVTKMWNPYCPVPNCRDVDLRHILFPSRDPRFFFQCIFDEGYWTVERFECQCDTLFNFGMQNCVGLHRYVPFCLEMNLPIMMNDCETGERRVIGTQSEIKFPEYEPENEDILDHFNPILRRF